MKSPSIEVASTPDTLRDVAYGATFYVRDSPVPLMRLRYVPGSPADKVFGQNVGAVCLDTGNICGLHPDTPVRVVELDAEVSTDEW